MATFGGRRSLQKMYGMNQGSASPTPLILGSELGFTITTATDRFPRQVAFLQSLGWTNTEILQRTYFDMAFNDAVLYGPQVLFAHECHDVSIEIPTGKWYYTSELRCGQHRTMGDSSRFQFGTGGTEIELLPTNYKSIYGAQNAGVTIGFVPWNYCGEAATSVAPVGFGAGTDWCHHWTLEDIRMNGGAPDGFWSSARQDIGALYYNAGECSGVFRCEFDDYNTFGIMTGYKPAYTNITDVSGFRNKVAIVGMRGGALSDNSITNISGDFNPYHIFQFRGGSDVFGAGAFLPHGIASNPGGTLTVTNFKLEDSKSITSAVTGLAVIQNTWRRSLPK